MNRNAKRFVSLALILIMTASLQCVLTGCNRTAPDGSAPAETDMIRQTETTDDSVFPGGSEITYEAVLPDTMGETELAKNMETVCTMLKQRLDAMGYTKAFCFISEERRLVVEIPSVADPKIVAERIGATAAVSIEDADGTVWLTGSEIKEAEYELSPMDSTGINRPHVRLTLTTEGQNLLARASSAVLARGDENNYLVVQIDNERINKSYVISPLNTDVVLLTASDDAYLKEHFNSPEEYYRYLASIISAGQLPFELTIVKQQTIGASSR